MKHIFFHKPFLKGDKADKHLIGPLYRFISCFFSISWFLLENVQLTDLSALPLDVRQTDQTENIIKPQKNVTSIEVRRERERKKNENTLFLFLSHFC